MKRKLTKICIHINIHALRNDETEIYFIALYI